MSRYTVIRIRERFVNQGLDDALTHRLHTQTRARALDGEQEAHLIALSCSPCPAGQARWTLRFLADRMVELGYTEHVSHETVRKVLKKTRLLPWLKHCWCIPPEASAAFVWRMEDVLEVYTRAYDPRFPQVCMDESAKQLLKDKRESLPGQPGQSERVDYTFEAAGMCKIFLASEPLAGKRFVKADFAPHERGLGSLHSRMSGCALSPSREACASDGQPQYPYPILLVFHLCPAGSPSHPQEMGNPLHACPWELAEYGRD